jgi:hypothetical protein
MNIIPMHRPGTMIWATASCRVCPGPKALVLFHLTCSSARHGERKVHFDRLQ